MRIAIVTSVENPTPPTGYGGTERVAAVAAEKLSEIAEVVLFAGPGSKLVGKVARVVTSSSNQMAVGEWENTYTLRDIHKSEPFDFAIDMGPNHLLGQGVVPGLSVISMMGGDPFRKYPDESVRNKYYISPSFARFCGQEGHPVIRNPVVADLSEISIPTNHRSYALYVGQVHRMKGLHKVLHAAQFTTNQLLVVYGPDRDDEQYINYINQSAKRFSELPSSRAERDKVFGGARVFVHPVDVCDADPIAPKEAMLYGVPVVASKNGGIIDTVKPGINGFFADKPGDFGPAIEAAFNLDPTIIRRSIEEEVNPDWYAQQLIALGNAAKNGRVW